MRMKSLSNFFIGMLAVCALAGCSDNEVSGNEPGKEPGHPEDAVYMNVSIQLPGVGGSTRSETEDGTDGEYGSSTGGTEVGKDRENNVNEILLVLADKDDKFIAVAKRESVESPKGGVIRTTQCISKSILSRYYDDHGSNGNLNADANKIHIYAFCNPTKTLKDYFEGVSMGAGNWINEKGTIVENHSGKVTIGADIWGGDKHDEGFLMSSATYNSVEKLIPVQFSDWEFYTNKSNAFDFSGENVAGSSPIDNKGNIKVERAVARFDFKDGSKGNQEYVFGEDNNKQATLKVKLTKIALVNMSKNFYYLRRVSDNGLPNGSNFKICGTEYDNGAKANYVVDTDAETKNNYKHDASYKFGDYFNFCLGHQTTTPTNSWSIDITARGQWYSQNITDVLKGEVDNNDKWNTDGNKGDYRIWRYVTENTIPGSDEQENGISTGIVFKGKILPTNDTPTDLANVLSKTDLKGNEDPNDPILYYYANILYVRWTQVREEAIKAGKTSDLYKAAFGNANNEPTHNADPNQSQYSDDRTSPDYLWRAWQTTTTGQADALKKFKEAATKTAGFTLYQASKEGNDEEVGYYCYYFYWNRHNDNGNDGVMGPMEFAVVRNNVYKLAVTNIKRLGHPRISENDPDPVKPDDPDEKEDVYLKLSVEVLPWVVRVNDIEF